MAPSGHSLYMFYPYWRTILQLWQTLNTLKEKTVPTFRTQWVKKIASPTERDLQRYVRVLTYFFLFVFSSFFLYLQIYISPSNFIAEAFKEICPAGHGYTYSSSDIRMSMRKAEADELPRSSEEQWGKSDRVPDWITRKQQLQEGLNGAVTDTLSQADLSAGKGKVTFVWIHLD